MIEANQSPFNNNKETVLTPTTRSISIPLATAGHVGDNKEVNRWKHATRCAFRSTVVELALRSSFIHR